MKRIIEYWGSVFKKKYRIQKNGIGSYRVQRRWFVFWVVCKRDLRNAIIFDWESEAQRFINNELLEKKLRKKRKEWKEVKTEKGKRL